MPPFSNHIFIIIWWKYDLKILHSLLRKPSAVATVTLSWAGPGHAIDQFIQAKNLHFFLLGPLGRWILVHVAPLATNRPLHLAPLGQSGSVCLRLAPIKQLRTHKSYKWTDWTGRDHWTTSPLEHRSLSGANNWRILRLTAICVFIEQYGFKLNFNRC